MLKTLTSARLFCLVLLCLATLSTPAHAQRLGGLPDPAFHPADSGLAVPQLNRKNQLFTAGPAGGLFMSTSSTPRKYETRGRHNYQFTSYYNPDGSSRYYNINAYISDQQGFLMQAAPGVHYLAQEGAGGYQQITDSIRIVPYSARVFTPGYTSRKPAAFYFYHPFRGFNSQGITPVSPSRLAFYTTYNPTDTAAPVNATYLRLIDTSGNPTATFRNIPNFRAEAISAANGIIYLLGYDMVDSSEAGTRIMAYSATNLSTVNQPFPFLETTLLGAKPQVFKALPDGKFLVAGLLWHSTWGAHVDMALRLQANGQRDPAWNHSGVNAANAAWHLDASNIFRSGSVSTTGMGGSAMLIRYGINGGGAGVASANLDPSYPAPRALCYQPEQDAFLFETHDLSPTLPPYIWHLLTDSTYGTRHRFYVGFNRQVKPLVNHHGIGMYGDYFLFNTNPRHNKILTFGSFTQINKKLHPMIALLNEDGTTDTTFRGVHKMDEPLRSQLLNYTGPACQLTNAGKVLFNFPNGYYSYYQGALSDSTYRLAQNGNVDYSYTKVWAPGSLIVRKRGGYTTVRAYTSTGDATSLPTVEAETEIRLVQMDAEGNFIREYGSYKPTGSPDTLAPVYGRWRDTFTEDEQGGIWMHQGWHMPIPGTNPQEWRSRQYYVRFDSTGRSRIIYPNFSIYEKPLKIEILANKRMRLTGAFNIPNGTLAGSIYNIIETDSTGLLDISILPIRYFVPDAYGRRTAYFVTPRKYLPDGKIMTTLSAYPGYSNLIMRHFPDGRQDPSFLPINMAIVQTQNLEVIGDNLYLGGENYGWIRSARNGGIRYLYGGSIKNGLHRYRISSVPGTVGFVQGRVQQVVSPATGCTPAGPRRPATGMLLRASQSARIAVADTGGYYFFALDTGRYDISQSIANNFLQRQVCPPATQAGQAPPPRAVHLARAGSTLLAQDFINQTFDCPRLEVTVLQPRFRLCSRSVIRLQYQNDGMADEPSARIRLNLPEEIRIEQSSHAFTRGTDSSFVFDLGRLRPGAHGEIVLRDTIGCPAVPDSLARACYSARIEPLSLCTNIDPTTLNWDGAWIDAEARYIQQRDVVRLVIRNRGGQMADSTPLRLVNTHAATYFDGKVKIDAGDSIVVEVPPAVQGSISLFVQQTPNCPLGSRSSLFHAGRGTARTFLHFGSGLLESYTVQACPSFRFSYDPNEKVVQPEGDIEPGTQLAYTIHFENFGNDTAYSVIVEDTLPAGLDVTTLRVTGSSTPCRLEVVGTETNPVVYFHFNPIKLTAKKQDSVRSKGQVDFTIRTFENVQRGSVISNRAHIYFDRNLPVITDYIHSPIANPQPLANRHLKDAGKAITLYPNPSQGSVLVKLSGANHPAGLRLTVTTLQGQVIHNRTLPPDGTLRLQGLIPGIYLVKAEGYKAQRLIIVR